MPGWLPHGALVARKQLLSSFKDYARDVDGSEVLQGDRNVCKTRLWISQAPSEDCDAMKLKPV